MNARLGIALVIASFAINACGSDAPSAPTISTLRLKPEDGVRPGEILTVVIDLQDDDGDLDGGVAEIGLLREGDGEGELFRVPLDAQGSITEATIGLDIHLPAGTIPGHYTLAVVILDRATRRSNALSTEFEVTD